MYDNPVVNKREARYSVPKALTPYVLLAAIALLITFTITFTFSFKERVLQTFFPKSLSFADEDNLLPKVQLLAQVGTSYKTRVLNVAAGKSNIVLKWKTDNNPISCAGNFWSNVKKASEWVGPKDIKGGSLTIADNLQPGVYVYSINCANEYGDAYGSNLTINVGAKQNSLQPHLVSFQAQEGDNNFFDISKPNQVSKNSKLKIAWSTVNTDTAYSVCVASGSWPTIYYNTGQTQVKENFTVDKAKIYQYQVTCSNEYGYDSRIASFVVK